MDFQCISDTPTAKRRKTAKDSPNLKAFDSENDSGDDLFNGYETIDTLPLPGRSLPTRSPTQGLTQPTQVFIKPDNLTSESVKQLPAIQIPASSPILSDPPQKKSVLNLATSIAPAGTSFRPPSLIHNTPDHQQKQKLVVEVSDDDDDGPQYVADSSEEEHQVQKANIKPISFGPSFKSQFGQTDRSRFQGILSNSKYEPSASMESTPWKPSKDFPLENIPDLSMRMKIKQMLKIMPHKSVWECRDALLAKKNNFQDAMDYLSQQDIATSPTAESRKPSAKQRLKEPVKKIHEKWMHSKARSKPADNLETPQSAYQNAPSASPKKIRRRLVRKGEAVSERSPEEVAIQVPSDSDSGLEITSSSDAFDDNGALEFLRTCSVADLVDIASVSEDLAQYFLSQRPFNSLDDIRSITKETRSKNGGRQRVQRVGERMVDKVTDMLTGYATVDKLIATCADLAKPLSDEIAKWGVGRDASDIGELEVVDIRPTGKDSGIGTPSSRGVSAERDAGESRTKRSSHTFFDQPNNLAPSVSLKDYQIFGFNWLYLLFTMNIEGAILADDMGLGKTCQIISFLAHLFEQGVKGPHVIVVPSSTLENWLREFSVFCPELNVVPYYASQSERANIRDEIMEDRQGTDVVLTTYAVAKMKDDNRFLRKLKPVCAIWDEGHMLRNCKAAGYDAYSRIPARFRCILSGTPLQNNLGELCSLLAFILPSTFSDLDELATIFNHKAKTDDGNSHAALLSTRRVQRAKSMMTPFVLRRKKYQVLRHLPIKTKETKYCNLSASQRSLYDVEREKAHELWASKAASKPSIKMSIGIMMNLRKASIHPCLFRLVFDNKKITKMAKACLKEPEFAQSNLDLVEEDLSVMSDMELHRFCERYKSVRPFALKNEEWMDSGKVEALSRLLEAYKANNDRVLVFSQFVQVLDILEHVMETLGVSFFRLDGSTNVAERQSMIDEYNLNPSITVFLLSTKAGGAGINLASANKVIIFDSSFNPQDDIQAENRAHRVGQTREVEVIRLVSRDTIEENILRLGETKLALDDRIAGATDQGPTNRVDELGMLELEAMLRKDAGESQKTAEVKQ